ncbi:MAG: sigma-54 dependent transcriptional regulator, partial [Ignavibacteria bacterium]|nr:sigma-54 dependent transcriptional regulator [Ignavibacteria bacterium]
MKTILVVDDDGAVRQSLKRTLEYHKYKVVTASNGQEALERHKEMRFDLTMLDIKMPGMDGLTLFQRLKESHPNLAVVMISAHGSIDTAVQATRLGALDFLQKPLDQEELLFRVQKALENRQLVSDYQMMKEKVEGKETILGESDRIKEVLAAIEQVAPTESSVLITGENGVGKELVAKAIHRRSKRSPHPLIEVNCAAIPNELIESELFGHEKGSFTGATGQRIGKFEAADGGTLFLDEIGDMSLNAQAKVLRALEERKVERVGGNKQIEVTVRVIAATNKNLPESIKRGEFREDLYHRLNVIPIHVPALRDRREDIPLLIHAFVEEICQRNGMPLKEFGERVVEEMKGMNWSGNVRELRNMVERLVIMTPGNRIESISTVGVEGGSQKSELDEIIRRGGTFQEFKDRAEEAYIRRKLHDCGWNI